MNWRRGLFRLWIVGAALFVIAVASISYSDIKAQFDAVASKPEAGAPSSLAGFRQRYPQYNDLSDTQLADRLYKKFYSDMPREQFDKKIAARKGLSDAEVGIGPPLKPVSDPALIAQLEAAPFDQPAPNPWARVEKVAGIAFGIPLMVLVLGASLVWAFSGFAATRP
jgi:hypothetical protein